MTPAAGPAGMATPFTRHKAGRLMLSLLGSVLLFSAMLTPWWTRGVTLDFNAENPRAVQTVAVEGGYAHYGPFSTPGSIVGISTDGYREIAVAILGVAMLLVIGFVGMMHVLRYLHAAGRIDLEPSVPVRLAMAATLSGVFAVLWAALFLPLLGPNPGWMYGTEVAAAQMGEFTEAARFANVGWFLGIAGGVLYPAALWVNAALDRNAAETAAASPAPTLAPARKGKATP